MIVSYADEITRKLMHGIVDRETRRYPTALRHQAARKLTILDAATRIEDLYFPPSNKMHALSGKMSEYFAINVNDQYRLIFRWSDEGPEEVEFTDYH